MEILSGFLIIGWMIMLLVSLNSIKKSLKFLTEEVKEVKYKI